jgi:hypothetical protein
MLEELGPRDGKPFEGSATTPPPEDGSRHLRVWVFEGTMDGILGVS